MKGQIEMFVSEDLAVNAQGHLTIDGADTVELAEKYGTPLYVMDEDLIRKNLRRFHDRINRGAGLYAFDASFCVAVSEMIAK